IDALPTHTIFPYTTLFRSQLTGTYQSSINAANQVDFTVEVIDSKIGAYALGKMIQNGIQLEKQGKSYEDIVTALKMYTKRAEMRSEEHTSELQSRFDLVCR